MEREVLVSSHWDPVIAHVGMVQSCARTGHKKSISLPKEWTHPGTSFLERWSMSTPVSVLEAFGQCP